MSHNICIVDDDPYFTEIMVNLLSMENYETVSFDSGPKVIDALNTNNLEKAIDAFVLDVVMSEMDGYELCRAIREIPQYEHTPILFVSGKSDLEDRMQGYEAGGNDYLPKPVQPEELKAKLARAMQEMAEHKELEQEVSRAMDMVTQVLSSVGELKAILFFMEKSVTCENFQRLAEELLRATGLLGVQCSALFWEGEDKYFQSAEGTEKPIEYELLSMARNSDPVVEFNNRYIYTQPHISLLVKGLPKDDEDKLERLKEQLPLLVGAADSRATALNNENQLKQHKTALMDMSSTMEQYMNQIDSNLDDQGQLLGDITEEFLITLHEDVSKLMLDEDQERQLKQMMTENVKKIKDMLGNSKRSVDAIREPFNEFLVKLRAAI